jgi:succinyl-diaminopimelate desuccinylase
MTIPETPAEFVRENQEDLVDLTLDILAVDTANPPGETRELAAFIEAYLDDLPVTVDRVTVDPAKPNLLLTLPGRSDETLLYNGHLDTVPYDREEWTYDPLGERVDGDLYGRGATDMKGPLAGMLFAIRAFAETDTTPPVDLQLAVVSDEEISGDAGLPALLEQERLQGDTCVIGEPTCEEGRHSVTVADRGSIWLTMEATGEAAHGSRPVLGENAIDRLYAGIERLRSEFGNRELAIDAEMQPIIQESVDYYGPMMGETAARELFEHPSINLGTFEGGEAINSVPQSARAEIDIRLTAGVQTPEILDAIRDCAADCEGVTIADVAWSIGTAEPIDSALVESVASTAEAVTKDRIYRRSATGGGDAKKVRNAGIPTVEFALGTDTVHAVDEYLPVEGLVANALIYAELPKRWAEESAGG